MKNFLLVFAIILFLLVLIEAHNRDVERKFCANAPECYMLDDKGNSL